MKHYRSLCNTCVLLLLWVPDIFGKPGVDYSTLPSDYEAEIIAGTYQKSLVPETPTVITTTKDLKSAGTYDFEYGAPHPEPILPIVPVSNFPIGKFGGWGWKPPHPIIAPFPIIAKPIHIPISLPFGWGWSGPGFF